MPQFFTPQFKQRGRLISAAVTMLAGAAPFVGGLLVMQVFGVDPHGPLPALVAVLSFALGGALPWLSQNLTGLAGNAALRARLRRHHASDPTCDLQEALFVGFSPGERLHIWHGETDRDIGFLTLDDDIIIYRGDDFSWSLPRDVIDHIDLTPVEAGLQRIIIRWHVPRETGRALSLESREAGSISRARAATNQLYFRLREWEKQDPAGRGADAKAAVIPGRGTPTAVGPAILCLGLPPTDMTGAQIIEEPPAGSCASILALGVIVVIAIWRITAGLFESGQYYDGILWAGLISVLGALSTGYLLHYLQAWEAEHGRQKQRV
ncbi:MAG: hypothetical protein WCP21_00615 [Armatimonadota bacterium]